MKKTRNMRRAATAATILVAVGFSPPAVADNGTDTAALRDAVSAVAIMDHLQELQTIADANGGTRAAGTAGYEASAVYAEEQLRAAGYEPVRQHFSYDQFNVDPAGTVLERILPTSETYTDEGDDPDFVVMTYSGAGDVRAPLTAVDINLAGDRAATSGCEGEDFAGFPVGNIALIQRGSCDFRVKVDNAAAAGAAGVIVFNQGNDVPDDDRFGAFNGTLNAPQATIPAVGTTFALGEELAGLTGVTIMRLAVDSALTTINSFNILADTTGRADRTVVVGAHLDSVAEGAGINDNGTGSAAILETALQLAESGDPENRVRFAFWGGEEAGLVGSDFYVSQLSARQLKGHAVNLNFDMVGSPNYVRFVYDGDGSAFGETGPNGSARVEQVFLDYFASQGLATEPTEFDGRSDYFGFIENGIPAGGLFTGAEGIKSAEEAVVYGGVAGAPYDPCYHSACDTLSNVGKTVLEEMADAIAHATLTFAETSSAINGTSKGQGQGNVDLRFKGDAALK